MTKNPPPEDTVEERDDQTFSMFGDDETGAPADGSYQVLARKYRPRLFEDLIGQEAMVRTLSNAFKLDRIAHAFMLTGVRGVGKTTTARLLARALNYTTNSADAPSINLTPPGIHCEAIMASRHPDIMELDAASRTGVADMRELLDGVRYSPVSARYKVYIIDEVHMLSTAAFNALLKTLEEPPAHVKFIFATTEIRKVPVTVLSRCQRFDLKRLDTAALAAHLGRIATKEGANVSEEGLALIARAAEGSVRDGLSVLDQAIVQATDGKEVGGADVRDMLGLGDRTRLLDVFEKATSGDGKAAVTDAQEQIHAGADPQIVLKDLLEICADVAAAQAIGDDYTIAGPSDWIERTKVLAKSISRAQADRYWQLLLSGYKDLQTAPDQTVALRMVILRLATAASLPSPEDAIRQLIESGASGTPGKPEPKSAKKPDMAPAMSEAFTGEIERFSDVVARLAELREVKLQVELETFVRPGTFRPGYFSCELSDGAPADLLRRLKRFLENDTDLDWVVEQEATETETLKQAETRHREEKFAEAAADPAVAAALKALPGATIIDVKDTNTETPDVTDSNVIDMTSRRQAKN